MSTRPTPPTTLILVRHGETLGNRHARFQTYDTPLSEEGRSQAARVAERLAADAPVHVLYTSDLARARETAALIGERVGLTPVEEPALRELDTGEWKGQLYAEVQARYAIAFEAWLAGGGRVRLPGAAGECCDDVADRTGAWLRRTLERHTGERVVAVTHGLTLAVLLAEAVGEDRYAALSRRIRQGNTAVNVVEIDGAGRPRIVLLNCTAHLDNPSAEARAL